MFGVPGGLLGTGPGGARQANAVPSGSKTGAPTRAFFRVILLPPGTPVGTEPTRIVEGERQNRVVTLTAPTAAFTVFVGGSGVNADGYSLPAGVPTEFLVPGFQELWAITDAPVRLNLLIQVSPILLGDTERE